MMVVVAREKVLIEDAIVDVWASYYIVGGAASVGL